MPTYRGCHYWIPQESVMRECVSWMFLYNADGKERQMLQAMLQVGPTWQCRSMNLNGTYSTNTCILSDPMYNTNCLMHILTCTCISHTHNDLHMYTY